MNARTLCLLLLFAAAPAALAGDDDPVVLEPLVVTAPPGDFESSRLLLRMLVAKSAPCLGCDAVLVEPVPSRVGALLNALLAHRSPNDVDEASRLALEVKLQDAPELEFLRP